MSYGFEAYRADGSTMVSTKDGISRLIYSADYSESFTGSVSVPTFNSNLGYYSYRMYPYLIAGFNADNKIAESSNFTNSERIHCQVSYALGPNLSWNNSSKILSISPNTETPYLFNGVIPIASRYRYRIMMVHYK